MENRNAAILGIIAGVGLAVTINVISSGIERKQKEGLVKQIMQKYGNSPGFEGTPETLMKLPTKTLVGILQGTIN